MIQTVTRDDVIAQARARSGLHDFGDTAILDGLDRLLAGYATEARFTERGYTGAIETLVSA